MVEETCGDDPRKPTEVEASVAECVGEAKLVLIGEGEAANMWPPFILGCADDGRRSSDDTNEADEVAVVSCTGSDDAATEAAASAGTAPCLGDAITACMMSAWLASDARRCVSRHRASLALAPPLMVAFKLSLLADDGRMGTGEADAERGSSGDAARLLDALALALPLAPPADGLEPTRPLEPPPPSAAETARSLSAASSVRVACVRCCEEATSLS